jgi:hypothetical protein
MHLSIYLSHGKWKLTSQAVNSRYNERFTKKPAMSRYLRKTLQKK